MQLIEADSGHRRLRLLTASLLAVVTVAERGAPGTGHRVAALRERTALDLAQHRGLPLARGTLDADPSWSVHRHPVGAQVNAKDDEEGVLSQGASN